MRDEARATAAKINGGRRPRVDGPLKRFPPFPRPRGPVLLCPHGGALALRTPRPAPGARRPTRSRRRRETTSQRSVELLCSRKVTREVLHGRTSDIWSVAPRADRVASVCGTREEKGGGGGDERSPDPAEASLPTPDPESVIPPLGLSSFILIVQRR
ncbi:hypothetical protein EYF80_040047 [Liparis tanakae]|uniref:Uncharacterized protein n=1 Tax=Liparis tanakae TaxID=230148 RepID=A0A4Z2G9L8_9TELE|nr:hypothetical protein EYF80_040047 [Liparis tanakae]